MKDSTVTDLRGDDRSTAVQSNTTDGDSIGTARSGLDDSTWSRSGVSNLLAPEGSDERSQQTRMTGEPALTTLLRASGRGIKAVARKGMDWTQQHLARSKSNSAKGAIQHQRTTTVEVREDPRAVQSGGEGNDSIPRGWGRGTKQSREEGFAVYGDGKPP